MEFPGLGGTSLLSAFWVGNRGWSVLKILKFFIRLAARISIREIQEFPITTPPRKPKQPQEFPRWKLRKLFASFFLWGDFIVGDSYVGHPGWQLFAVLCFGLQILLEFR